MCGSECKEGGRVKARCVGVSARREVEGRPDVWE